MMQNKYSPIVGQDDQSEAIPYLKEEERICRELNDIQRLHKNLGIQVAVVCACGISLFNRGEFKKALTDFKDMERICRELEDQTNLQIALGNQAASLKNLGAEDGAIALYIERERICKEIGKQDDLRITLEFHAGLLMKRGEYSRALEILKDEEKILRELDLQADLSANLINQAKIKFNLNLTQDALPLAEESFRMAMKNGNENLLNEHIRPLLDIIRQSLKTS